jgi:hypothetical protein
VPALFLGVKNESRTRKLSKGFIWVAAVIAACLWPKLAFGQTNSAWNGGTGNWSNASDWTPNGAPNNGGGNTYNVTIDSGGTDTVTLNQNAIINSLVLGGATGMSTLQTLSGASETLNISGGLTLNSGGNIIGSTLTVGGVASIDGNLTGTTITASQDASIAGNLTGSTLQVAGNATISGSDLEQASSIIVSGNLTGSFSTNQSGNPSANNITVKGTFTNQGAVNLGTSNDFSNEGGGSSVNAYQLVNNGSIVDGFSNNYVNVTSTLTNNGSISGVGYLSAGIGINNGYIGLGQTDEHETRAIFGTLINNAQGYIQISSGEGQTLEVGTLENYGSISSAYEEGGNIDVSGSIFNSGTIQSSSDIVIGAFLGNSASNISLSGGGTVVLNGGNIFGAVPTDVLTNVNNTIEGSGFLGYGNMGLVNKGTILANQPNMLQIAVSSAGFSNQGIVQVNTGDTLYITGTSNSFLNFNSTTDTLTGGTYIVSGTLEFDGANIVTNAADIELSGSTSAITDQHGNNALAGFTTNATGGVFYLSDNRNFTTAGNFTNNGILNVGEGTTFAVGTNGADNLTNFSGNTLKGGTYVIGGTLEFNGANIVTNDASITLSGTGGRILDQNGNNALAGFNNNASGGTFALLFMANFSSTGNFTDDGTLNIGSGSTFEVGSNGGSNLTNFSGTTLTGGTYIVAGTLQFNGANIVTNAANITLMGTTSAIENQTGANGLANFATNAAAGSFTLAGGRNFTTSGAFSNAGKLTISKGSTFTVGGTDNYTQTAGTTAVSGILSVGSLGSVTLSGGSVVDTGTITTGSYTQTAGTTTVSGALAVTSSNGMKVSGGSVSDTGAINVNSYTQTAGTTTVKGTLSVGASGGVSVSGGSIVDTGTITAASYTQTLGTTTVSGTLDAGGVNVSGGSVLGVGTITGNIDLTGGLLSAGAATKKAGELTVKGTYAQSGAGAFDVDLGGTKAGTQYDVLDITSTAKLGGVLNVDLIGGFKPTAGETFDIMDYTSETGTFATLNLPKLTGGDTWAISYNATDVVLTVDGPGAAASTEQPVAILSRATCFPARLLGSASCGKESIATGGEIHAASIGRGAVHNNIMVATRSNSGARGASRESSASAAAMARLYVCAYLPSSVAHTMGCN